MKSFFQKNENEYENQTAKQVNWKRHWKRYQYWYLIVGGVLLLLLVGVGGFGIYQWSKNNGNAPAVGQQARMGSLDIEQQSVEGTVEETLGEEERKAQEAQELESQREAEKQAVVDSYENLGLIQASSYVNLREEPSTSGDVIGKLYANSGCNILSQQEGWYQVSSGGLTGYVSSEYVLTGEEARTQALQYVEDYAIVQADTLNIRTEPSTSANTLGQAYQGERYRAERVEDGWVFNGSGYMSAEYVEIQLALNEARKLDLRSMVINLYDNPGVSNVEGYLNIRDKASEEGKIIGKMPGNCGAEILEELDGWYKIKSGPVTGYVKSDYLLTGANARQAAIDHAELMAIVSTDMLNARTEPSTEASIWTQISNNERYAVVSQTDGWVEIELDTETAFVSTDYVDVRYALPEAIKFTPLEGSNNSGTGSSKTASKRTQIVNYAMQFLGNPYVWGGTSLTKGADCSGFTMQIMKKFGVSLPHHSGSQAQYGKRISSSEMRPGDLIFYANSAGTINHVAMYIGNGQIIHAASRRSGIKISSWNYRTPARIVNVLGD